MALCFYHKAKIETFGINIGYFRLIHVVLYVISGRYIWNENLLFTFSWKTEKKYRPKISSRRHEKVSYDYSTFFLRAIAEQK